MEVIRRTVIARRLIAFVLLSVSALATSGCAGAAAYDRGKLAHPTMTSADLAGQGEEHMRAIQEGATGGGFEAGGGCGCN